MIATSTDSLNVKRFYNGQLRAICFTTTISDEDFPSGLLPGSREYLKKTKDYENHFLFLELHEIFVVLKPEFPIHGKLNDKYDLVFEKAQNALYKAKLDLSGIKTSETINKYVITIECRLHNDTSYKKINIDGIIQLPIFS